MKQLADYDAKLTADILEQVKNGIISLSAAATQLDTNAKQVSRWIEQLKKKRCTFAELAAQCKSGRPKKITCSDSYNAGRDVRMKDPERVSVTQAQRQNSCVSHESSINSISAHLNQQWSQSEIRNLDPDSEDGCSLDGAQFSTGSCVLCQSTDKPALLKEIWSQLKSRGEFFGGDDDEPTNLDPVFHDEIHQFDLDGWHVEGGILNEKLKRNWNTVHLVHKDGQFYSFRFSCKHRDPRSSLRYYVCQGCTTIRRRLKNAANDSPQSCASLQCNPNTGYFKLSKHIHLEGCNPVPKNVGIALKHKREAKLLVKQKVKPPKEAYVDAVVGALLEVKEAYGLEEVPRGPGTVAQMMGCWPQTSYNRFARKQSKDRI